MDDPNIHRLSYEGKELILVGVAHVSRESAELAEAVIAAERPDAVCVELCKSRYEAIKQRDKWQEMNIVKVIREKRTSVLLFQLLLASFQKKIAEKFGITPGEEMIRAIAKAEEVGAEVVLADREIRITLLRAWRKMGFWTKIRVLPEMIVSLFYTEDITEEEIEKLKQQDVLEVALQTFGKKLPSLKTTLIDERDEYLSHTISHAAGKKIVAIVGAGHMPGIKTHIGHVVDMETLNQIPPPGLWARYAGWGFSAVIVLMFIAGFFYSGGKTSMDMIIMWSAITAACAGVGALIMLAHPLTILSAALSAPIATIHPLIATGWIAGLVEATLRKPQVRDFLALKDDISSVRGFFRNKITRLLILVAFVNLTTSVGTLVAIPVVMKYFFTKV
ncbi:MAG: TraB/GumN family protein [Syntrophales bacterium]|nr:TraB/GumN family protein [Syntrophales bacterium]MCK9390209.1 TraB/GumN family protein [Syntrophales bacterium]